MDETKRSVLANLLRRAGVPDRLAEEGARTCALPVPPNWSPGDLPPGVANTAFPLTEGEAVCLESWLARHARRADVA